MNEYQGRKDLPPRNTSRIFARDNIREAKKSYEVPELVKLGDVADLTNYDVSVIV